MSRTARSPALIALGALDVGCALAHALFEPILLGDVSPYREFLLVENLLVGFVFLLLGGGLLRGDDARRRVALGANAGFWAVFLVAVALFRPPVTTLDPLKAWLPVPQAAVLLATGALALGLTIAGIIRSRAGQSVPGVN